MGPRSDGGAEPSARPSRWTTSTCYYLLYTRNDRQTPKGIIRTSRQLPRRVAFTPRCVFDLRPEHDIFWCTAERRLGRRSGYIIYGPLANGATVVIYEGVPDRPGNDRFWAIVEVQRSRSPTPPHGDQDVRE